MIPDREPGGLPLETTPNEPPLAKVLGIIEAQHLGLKRGFGEQRSSRCPAHDDHEPSLSISVGDDGRVLLHCFAGCKPEQVVAALGLKMRDLFVSSGSSIPVSSRPARRRNTRRLTGVNEKIYSIVPAMISEQACPTCVALYSALDLRCGKDNRVQRGLASTAAMVHVDERTVMVHARHLAETGWINLDDGATETGGHKAAQMSIRHNPARRRFADDVRPPMPWHAKRSPWSSKRVQPMGQLSASTDAPREAQRMRQSAEKLEHPVRDTLDTLRGNGKVDTSRVRYTRVGGSTGLVGKKGTDDQTERSAVTRITAEEDLQARSVAKVLMRFRAQS